MEKTKLERDIDFFSGKIGELDSVTRIMFSGFLINLLEDKQIEIIKEMLEDLTEQAQKNKKMMMELMRSNYANDEKEVNNYYQEIFNKFNQEG